MRKRKRKRKHYRSTNRIDCHHIFWERRQYKGHWLKALREHPYCRAYIPKDTLHKTIHCRIKFVPLPEPSSARDAISELEQLAQYKVIHNDDPLERKLLVLKALFDCVEEQTAFALKQQLQIVREFYSPQ